LQLTGDPAAYAGCSTAGEITPHLSLPHGVNENLVLDGLALIARNA